MAFDHVGFFTVLGKFVKTIDTVDGYHDAIETLKTEIRDVYEGEDLHDLYATMPTLVSGFQTNFTSFINSLITDLQNGLFADRDYVLEQLTFSGSGTTAVLNALYNYMVDNSLTIESSVVSIGGSDADKAAGTVSLAKGAYLLCTRILDGVNNPGNGVSAHLRYLGAESQLARSTTAYAEVTSVASLSSESVQLFPTYSSSAGTGAYVLQDEEPAIGPTLVNGLSTRIGLVNADFNTFTADSGDSPDNWTLTGGTAGTDWSQQSNPSTDGEGITSGLKVVTSGVSFKQQVTGLSHNTSYGFFIFSEVQETAGESCDLVCTLETNAGSSIKALGTFTTEVQTNGTFHTVDNQFLNYAFFTLAESVSLTDLYLKVVVNNFTGTPNAAIYQVGVVPVSYWNGLGWVYVSPKTPVELGTQGSLAVANNDNGVFQRFFRKAFAIQLPTADSPNIADSLAT